MAGHRHDAQELRLPTPIPPLAGQSSASPESTPRGKLARFALFLRQVWHLAMPYFKSDERWKAIGLLAAVVGLNLAAVYMLVLLNTWNKVFYDALQNKDAAVFWQQLGRFFWLAVISFKYPVKSPCTFACLTNMA